MNISKLLSFFRFSFQVKHPSIEDCWQTGYEQALSHQLEDNPHTAGTSAHHHWAEGWWAGFYGRDNQLDHKHPSDQISFLLSGMSPIEHREASISAYNNNKQITTSKYEMTNAG